MSGIIHISITFPLQVPTCRLVSSFTSLMNLSVIRSRGHFFLILMLFKPGNTVHNNYFPPQDSQSFESKLNNFHELASPRSLSLGFSWGRPIYPSCFFHSPQHRWLCFFPQKKISSLKAIPLHYLALGLYHVNYWAKAFPERTPPIFNYS